MCLCYSCLFFVNNTPPLSIVPSGKGSFSCSSQGKKARNASGIWLSGLTRSPKQLPKTHPHSLWQPIRSFVFKILPCLLDFKKRTADACVLFFSFFLYWSKPFHLFWYNKISVGLCKSLYSLENNIFVLLVGWWDLFFHCVQNSEIYVIITLWMLLGFKGKSESPSEWSEMFSKRMPCVAPEVAWLLYTSPTFPVWFFQLYIFACYSCNRILTRDWKSHYNFCITLSIFLWKENWNYIVHVP